MAQIISASIDVTKIDKSKLIEGKNGAKYYNFQINVNDEKDKYGQDVALSEAQTKQQRDAKEKRKFIGNGKVVWRSSVTSVNQHANASEHHSNDSVAFDDLHF